MEGRRTANREERRNDDDDKTNPFESWGGIRRSFRRGAICDGRGPSQKGGTLTASMDLQPVSLYPLYGNAAAVDRNVYNQIFDSLLRLEADGSLSAGLAESWHYADDKQSITFKLRQGVKFHDGTPFDGDAALANMNKMIDPSIKAPRSAEFGEVKDFELVDPMTLKANLKSPSGAILVSFATDAFMSSPTAMKKFGEDYGRNPVGTGAFKFVRWQQDEFIEMERNADYWRSGADGKSLPYVDKIVMRFNPNNATKIIEVESGNVALADAITPRDVQQLKGNDRVQLIDPPSGGILSWMSFNIQSPPFDNIELRRAVIAGLDRKGMLQAIALGVGSTPPVMFAPSEWAFSEQPDQPRYDLAAAKEHLAKSGLPSPVQATLRIIRRDPDVQVAQLIQAQLSQIGITVKIEVMERSAWVAAIGAKEFQFGIGRFPVPYADPDQICRSVEGRSEAVNWSNIPKDDQLRKLVLQARSVVSHEERKPKYQEIQKYLIDQAYYDFLFIRGEKHIANPGLRGVGYEVAGAWYLDKAYFV